jgi:hypothetical protein
MRRRYPQRPLWEYRHGTTLQNLLTKVWWYYHVPRYCRQDAKGNHRPRPVVHEGNLSKVKSKNRLKLWLLLNVNTPSGLEGLSWLPSPPSNRCGSRNKNTTSLVLPSSTGIELDALLMIGNASRHRRAWYVYLWSSFAFYTRHGFRECNIVIVCSRSIAMELYVKCSCARIQSLNSHS